MLIPGKNPLSELLDNLPELIVKVYQQKNKEDKLIQQRLKIMQVECQVVTAEEMTKMVGDVAHQGFVAKILDRPSLSVKELLKRNKDERQLVVALDGVTDPHNLGAILRSCECMGVSAVIIREDRQVGLTPTVAKVSAGASSLVDLIFVKNLSRSIKEFQSAGFWSVATIIDKSAVSLYEFDFPEKTLLVLGSEQKGVSRLVAEKSDFKVYIPMQGKIDSLNVAQSAAVFLSHWRRSQLALT